VNGKNLAFLVISDHLNAKSNEIVFFTEFWVVYPSQTGLYYLQ